jgi:threonyl-tRNA synthetase
LKAVDVRVKVDDSAERMNQKIRQAQLEKVPCMLIVGEKEVSNSAVSVRLRSGQQFALVPFSQFKEKLIINIATKAKDFGL